MLQVVCGIIYREDEIFLCRRKPEKSMGGYWEFPGGKIEPGERPEYALLRELQEELNMQVLVERYFATVRHTYPSFRIELIAYTCRYKESDICLTDHDQFMWVKTKALLDWKLSPADIPLAQELINDACSYNFLRR